MPEKSTRKAGLEVCGEMAHPVSIGKKNIPSSKAYLSVSVIQFFLDFISYIQAAFTT